MKTPSTTLSVFSPFRFDAGSLCRLFALFALASASVSPGNAAEIVQAGRNLQVVLDMVDYGPLAGDETFDIRGTSVPVATYADTAQASNVQNDNSAEGTAALTSTLDVAGLKFAGTGSSNLRADLRFDAADVASGAFLDASSFSAYSVGFKIASSGKLVLSGSLLANGTGQRAWVRVERLDGSGVALWAREISAGSASWTTEIPLGQGSYLVRATAIGQVQGAPAGPTTIAGSASFDFSAQVVEAVTPTPPGKKPRK